MTRVHWSTWLALAGVVAGLAGIMAFAPRASAAQEGLQEPGLELRYVHGYSVTLYVADPVLYGWSHKRISGFFEKRSDCEKVKARTLPKVKGGRLACDVTDELMLVPVGE